MSKIEKALLDATGVKPKKGEERQAYLTRIVSAVLKLPEDKWEALAETSGAQDWANAAIEADDKNKKIEDFPDLKGGAAEEEPEEDDDTEEAAEEEEAEEDEAPAKGKAKDKAPAKADKGKAAAKAKAKDKKASTAAKDKAKDKERTPPKRAASSDGKKGPSMRRTLKIMVVKKPKMSVEDLTEQLEKKGHKAPSKLTVSSIRSDTRDTIKVLNELGVTQIEL